jgi:hypothetical protein
MAIITSRQKDTVVLRLNITSNAAIVVGVDASIVRTAIIPELIHKI